MPDHLQESIRHGHQCAFFAAMGYRVGEVSLTRLIGDAAHAHGRRPKVA